MPLLSRLLTFSLATALLSGVATAQQPPHATLLALSKRDHTLALIDSVTLKVLAKVPIGDDPHEVIASTDGRTAYVSNYGFGSLHTITPVDLTHAQPLPPIDLGPLTGPHGLAFVDGELWFTAEGAKAIGRFDPATQKVDWILGTGQNRTHMISVAPGAQHIITTNVSSGTVDLIDREQVRMPPPPPGAGGPPPPTPANAQRQLPANAPAPHTDWNETVIKVGDGSEGFDPSPDGKEIWVGNAQDGTVSVIDRATKTVTATIAADVPGANRLKFTPDGRHVLVSTLGGSDLVVLDAQTRAVVKRVPLGHGAAGILVEPNGRRAFVACTPDNNVAVLDLATLTVTAHINVGPEPDGLAWAMIP